METLYDIVEACDSCNICARECAFLKKYGSPGKICDIFLLGEDRNDAPVFECNLCGLCQEVCPKNLDCAAAFLDIRRAVQNNLQTSPKKTSKYNQHKRICAYEAQGTTSLFSLYLFPEHCESVFFPGCTLAATRSTSTRSTYAYLKTIEPTVGIVLDCCLKPSHDLGLNDKFEKSFAELSDHLRENNIKKIFTACPSCYITFKTYAPGFETFSIYEVLAENPPFQRVGISEKFTVHDTCSTRFVSEIHDSVRTLISGTGADINEMEHSRSRAICCGEGAAAVFMAPDITGAWKTVRKNETAGTKVITYCAGCSSTLAKELPVTHLLDLLFDQDKALAGKEKIAKAPFTYINRLLLKNRLKRADKTAQVICRSSMGRKEGSVFHSEFVTRLTMITFSHCLIATCVCLLLSCIAFI